MYRREGDKGINEKAGDKEEELSTQKEVATNAEETKTMN